MVQLLVLIIVLGCLSWRPFAHGSPTNPRALYLEHVRAMYSGDFAWQSHSFVPVESGKFMLEEIAERQADGARLYSRVSVNGINGMKRLYFTNALGSWYCYPDLKIAVRVRKATSMPALSWQALERDIDAHFTFRPDIAETKVAGRRAYIVSATVRSTYTFQFDLDYAFSAPVDRVIVDRVAWTIAADDYALLERNIYGPGDLLLRSRLFTQSEFRQRRPLTFFDIPPDFAVLFLEDSRNSGSITAMLGIQDRTRRAEMKSFGIKQP